MGGVQVLHPQDLLNYHRHRHHHHHRNFHAYSNRNNFSSSTSPMKSQSPSLPIPNSATSVSRSSNRRKRSPPKTTPAPPKVKLTATLPLMEKDTNKTTFHKNTAKPTTDLVIGQVKILKRGEVLPTSAAKDTNKEDKVRPTTTGASNLNDLVVLSSTDLLDPKPDVAPKSIRISDFYAGSAFVTSPEPSSLPVPVFFKKKEDVFVDGDGSSSTNYDATTGLRRLLRLDLS